jgi:hypothetical protein
VATRVERILNERVAMCQEAPAGAPVYLATIVDL